MGARVVVERLGRVGYERAVAYQKELVGRVSGDPAAPEYLLLLEHPPVITIGRSARDNHLLAGVEALRRKGVEVHRTTRGGDITYHGPGQLVAYPILRLDRSRSGGVRGYLRKLEEVVIEMLSAYNIEAERDARYTGVWVGGAKICALGVAVTRWVTWHGLALNVNTDLSYFDLIVPCGIRGRGVTSLAKELGRTADFEEAQDRLEEAFGKVMARELVRAGEKGQG
ncbi:MAG: lipoyl(octanoyl) transferase LipB [Planctomycetota bacterium]